MANTWHGEYLMTNSSLYAEKYRQMRSPGEDRHDAERTRRRRQEVGHALKAPWRLRANGRTTILAACALALWQHSSGSKKICWDLNPSPHARQAYVLAHYAMLVIHATCHLCYMNYVYVTSCSCCVQINNPLSCPAQRSDAPRSGQNF